MIRPLSLDRIGEHTFQALQEGDEVFVVHETPEGWKTEGHPAFAGLLCESKDDLVARIEGREV